MVDELVVFLVWTKVLCKIHAVSCRGEERPASPMEGVLSIGKGYNVRLAFLVPEVERCVCFVFVARLLYHGRKTLFSAHLLRGARWPNGTLSRGQCFPCNRPSSIPPLFDNITMSCDRRGTYSAFLFFQRRPFPPTRRNVYILVYIIHGILKMRDDEILLSRR